MKKIIVATVFIFAVLVTDTFGQTMSGVSLREYSRLFLSGAGFLAPKYVRAASEEDRNRIRILGGNLEEIDTSLEIALLSNAAGVIDVRPVQAKEMLGDAKQTDLILGAWVFQEIQVLRFLGNTLSLGRHEGELKIITDRKNVKRAEVEAYYRNGIRTLVSDTVDEEFNKISFLLENSSIRKAHNAVLTRNPQNGQYILSYGGVNTNDETRTVTGDSLEALSHAMRNGENKSDFDETGISAVRARAALIPAVVYEDWKAKGLGDGLALIKEALTNFYLNPSKTTYNNLVGIFARYNYLKVREHDVFASLGQNSLERSITSLNPALMSTLSNDISTGNVVALMRVPKDPRFDVFSTPYAVGGE